MAKSEGQKLKLLYIIKMLEEFSDENHPLSTAEIMKRLITELKDRGYRFGTLDELTATESNG